MMNFDAPDRYYCVVNRQKTSTPLQSLVLMNDPQYIEALTTSMMEFRYLSVLYGLNQPLLDAGGQMVWEPTDELRDETAALVALKAMHWSAGQLQQIKEDIDNLTLSEQQKRDREELENFS